MFSSKFRGTAAAVALALFATSAHSALFIYDFDFQFDMSGDDVGGFRNEGAGGALTGYFSIDEKSQIQNFDFEFQIIQRATRFQGDQTDDVRLSKAGEDFFGTTITPPAGGQPERTTFGFSEKTGSVQCSYLNAIGTPFSLTFSAFSFTPGDSSVAFRADSRRATPSCNQFGGLGYAIPQSTRQQQISLRESGTLRPTPEVSTVPVPAAGLLLMGAFGVLAGLKRRVKQ